MNPPNKKSSQVVVSQQQVKRQATPTTHPFKPHVPASKNATAASNVRRPVAPAAYRPQAKPDALQQKPVASVQMKLPSAAPPVYRPQPVPKVLQTKSAVKQQSSSLLQSVKKPTAPPAYQPHLVPKVLQTKQAGNQQPSLIKRPERKPVAPPVYRPQRAPKILQRKEAANNLNHPNLRAAQVQPYKNVTGVGHTSLRATGNGGVIQRAGIGPVAQVWHCSTCNEEIDYGFARYMPNWACENGHTNWVVGAAPVAQAEEAVVEVEATEPPRKGELMEQFKGKALVKNKQSLIATYYGSGKNKSHISHGSSSEKQFSMRDELKNLLDAIAKTGDDDGYEAARKAINADFGTSF
jgi:hypothetical protein